jgi:hypothetical protein
MLSRAKHRMNKMYMLLATGREIRYCIMVSCLNYYNSRCGFEAPVRACQLLTTTFTTKRGILQQFTTYSSGFYRRRGQTNKALQLLLLQGFISTPRVGLEPTT